MYGRPASLRLRASLWLLAALMLVTSLVTGSAHAEWIVDGNPVCTAPGDQFDAVAVSDAAGGIVVVWRDQRRGASFFDLYASRILADGTVAPGWPANGKVLSEGSAGFPAVVPDGAGGVLVCWQEGGVRMQHALGSGAIAPGFPANGLLLPITVGGPGGYHVRAAADGNGGAYVMANRYNGTTDAAYVTRVDGSGSVAPGWSWSGVAMGGSPWSLGWGLLEVARDGTGSVLYFERIHEEDFIGSSWLGKLSRASATGTVVYFPMVQPTGHDGTGNGHHSVLSLFAIPDDAGGAFAAWSTGGTPAGNFAQHYQANGTVTWPIPTTAPVVDRLFADGSGGIYLLGHPYGATNAELHRRAGDGSTPSSWTGGRSFGVSAYTGLLGITSGARVYACWTSGGGVDDDIRAIAYTGVGDVATNWHATGDVVCDAAGQQTLGGIVTGAQDDALISWVDKRSGTGDVYVSRLATTGAPGVGVPGGPVASTSLAIQRVAPNPVRASAEIVLTSPDEDPVELEVLDPAGRRVRAASIAGAPGPRSWTLGTQGMSSGLYFVRVRHGQHTAIRRISVLP